MTDFLQDHPNGQVIAADEMSLYLQATTTRLWAARGQTPVVRVSGQRDHVHLYGALNLCNGHEFALPRLEMTSVETADFLRDLFYCYPDQPILLLWDRARWHKSALAGGGGVRIGRTGHQKNVFALREFSGCPTMRGRLRANKPAS